MESCGWGWMLAPPVVAQTLIRAHSQVWAKWPPSHPAPDKARVWLTSLLHQGQFQLLATHGPGHSQGSNLPPQLGHKSRRCLSPGDSLVGRPGQGHCPRQFSEAEQPGPSSKLPTHWRGMYSAPTLCQAPGDPCLQGTPFLKRMLTPEQKVGARTKEQDIGNP